MTLGLSAEEWQAVRLSLEVASRSVLVSLVPAIGVAWLLARGRFPGRMLLDALVHLPLVLPPVVTGYALLLLLGRKGLIGAFLDQQFGIVFAFRWTGAVVAAVVMALPIIVRAIRLSIEAVDVRLEQASGTLGAGRIATFFLVTLPLSLPGILAGATLGFAKALGEFGATITFVSNIPGETRTIASAIYTASQTPDGDAEALALSAVAAVLGLIALVASELLARRARGALS